MKRRPSLPRGRTSGRACSAAIREAERRGYRAGWAEGEAAGIAKASELYRAAFTAVTNCLLLHSASAHMAETEAAGRSVVSGGAGSGRRRKAGRKPPKGAAQR